MKMSPSELNRFKDAAEKVFQAELVCALVEIHPNEFQDSEITAIASLLKRLTGEAGVFLNNEIFKQEQANENSRTDA